MDWKYSSYAVMKCTLMCNQDVQELKPSLVKTEGRNGFTTLSSKETDIDNQHNFGWKRGF